MALRCERCRTSELTLETFGVYRCPVCGRVDADGNLVDQPAEGDDTGPVTLETDRASFAAPPPPATVAPIAASIPTTSTPTSASSGLPTTFLATLGVVALVDLAGAIAAHAIYSVIGLIVFYGGLLTGKRWARTSAMAGAVLTIGLCAMAFVLPQIGAQIRVAMVVLIGANAWWLYVLSRADTAAHFAR
jgi:hypothetical protein